MEKYFFCDYEIDVYFRPGKSLTADRVQHLYTELYSLNKDHHNFKFGLFYPHEDINKIINIMNNLILCMIRFEGKLVGYAYYSILCDLKAKPFVQVGLIVITKNIGVNIFSFTEYLLTLYSFKKLGFFNSGVITTIPKVAEEFCSHYTACWPNPRCDLRRAPPGYKQMVKLIETEYIQIFFPLDYSVNLRRFTLKLDKRESGFHDKFHELPMARSFIYNSFCNSWIDYEQNEDLIIVGKFSCISLIKTMISYYRMKLFHLLYKLGKHK